MCACASDVRVGAGESLCMCHGVCVCECVKAYCVCGRFCGRVCEGVFVSPRVRKFVRARAMGFPRCVERSAFASAISPSFALLPTQVPFAFFADFLTSRICLYRGRGRAATFVRECVCLEFEFKKEISEHESSLNHHFQNYLDSSLLTVPLNLFTAPRFDAILGHQCCLCLSLLNGRDGWYPVNMWRTSFVHCLGESRT